MKITRKFVSLMIAIAILTGNLLIGASLAGTVMNGIGFVDAASLRLRSAPNTTASTPATAGNGQFILARQLLLHCILQ